MSSRSTPSSGESVDRGHRRLAAAAMVAMAIFVFYGGDRSVWLDEAFSLNLATRSFGQIVEELKLDGHPPLYFFMLSIWTRIFGEGELAARSLSGLFYVATVAAIYGLARSVFRDRATALTCALLYLASKPAVAHAQNVRMYSLLALCVTLSTWFYLRSFFTFAERRSSDLVLYAVATALGTFTHFWFAFTLFAQVVTWLVYGEHRRSKSYLSVTALALVPFTVLWLPILFRYQLHHGISDWMSRRSFGIGLLPATLTDYYGEGILGALVWAAALAVVLLRLDGRRLRLPTAEHLRRLTDHLRSPRVAIFALLVVMSLLTPLLISQVRPIYRIGSYTIIGLVPLCLLLGSTLERLGQRTLVVLFLGGLLLGSLGVFLGIRSRPEDHSDRIAARYLASHADARDTVIFTSLSRPAIDYYLRRLAPELELERFTFPREIDRHPGWRSTAEMLERRGEIEAEAERIVAELEGLRGSGHQVWLFYGIDTKISNILRYRLEERWQPVARYACPTGFFTEILTYEPRSETPEPAAGES